MEVKPCAAALQRRVATSTAMKRVLQAPNLALATLWTDQLRDVGITASVQRAYSAGIAGELPPDQCRPEIWLRHAEHEAAARQLLDDLAHLPQRRWHCARCGEWVEGGFEQCWNCGAWMPRDEAEPATR